MTARMAQVIYAFPRLAFQALGRYQDVVQDYFEVLQGRDGSAIPPQREEAPEGVSQRPPSSKHCICDGGVSRVRLRSAPGSEPA